jgi:hypothetical protein
VRLAPLRAPAAQSLAHSFAVSLALQRQPEHSVGRPRFTFNFPRRRSTSPEAAGRLGHIVKRARILRPVSCSPQPQPHFIRGPAGRPRLTFEASLGGPCLLMVWGIGASYRGRCVVPQIAVEQTAHIEGCKHPNEGQPQVRLPPHEMKRARLPAVISRGQRFYSFRSAIIGSTRDALRAGIRQASAAEMLSTTMTPPSAAGVPAPFTPRTCVSGRHRHPAHPLS